MRGKDLLECMEYIDDALVEEALEPAPARRGFNAFAKWGMAAACVAVAGISATVFWTHQNIRSDQMDVGEDTAVQMTADTTAAGSDNGGNSSENSMTAGASAEGKGNSDADSGDAVSSDLQADTKSSKENEYENVQEFVTDYDSAVQDSEDNMALAEASDESAEYTIISDYYGEKDDSVYDYPVPEKGKFFCYYYLNETMKYYAAKEGAADPIYAYEVAIDLYGDVEIEGCRGIHYEDLNMLDSTDDRNEMIEQEYLRLSELGYHVQLSEDFRLTGIFTKVELDTFQASPEYGYTFRFANEF